MKKTFLAIALFQFLILNSPLTHAQQVVDDSFTRLQVRYSVPTPELHSVMLVTQKYDILDLPGYQQGGVLGAPSLPIRCDIIEVPFCDDMVVSVANAVYDTLQLSTNGILPLQPSRSKSDTLPARPLLDAERYATNAFWGVPLAEVEFMGVARDRRLALLRFSPLQVNPVTGQVVVCRSADVTISYVASDADRTQEHYRRYHTPAFSVGTTLNSLYSNNQTIKQSNNLPIRMVIAVPNVLSCNAIERFANWKRSQGLLVDVLNYQDMGITTNTDLASYLTMLYDSASDDSPAPTFLLLVGDNNQLNAFDSELPYAGYWSGDPSNDHVTDLYFATWTSSDNLPDCYQGRFSATDTATLASIVDKTILYEQYAFADDSYLTHAALIAGEDDATHNYSDYAWVYADPNMDYIAYNYINADHGYDQVTYYKNDTSYAPSGVTITGYCSANATATALRNLYSTGIGWINYSAHGDWDKWHKPSFTVSHVNAMTNNNKPSFMIGNCCLSSKFNKPTCFAEALLRKAKNAGAVAYIGGTNSTYWEQDFDWSVGLRSNISHAMTPNYIASKLGIYDRLFHTHDEALSSIITTAGAIVYFGNLAVNSSTSSSKMKKYYWEIYELMGDPSLMPWLGRAADLDAVVNRTSSDLTVTTVPNAYVAFVNEDDHQLIAAAYANASGVATFDIPASVDLSGSRLSVTSQNHKPYSRLFPQVSIDNPDALAALRLYPNPATDRVTIDGLPQGSTVALFDAHGRNIQTIKQSSIDVSSLTPGLYILRIQTPDGITVRKIVKQ